MSLGRQMKRSNRCRAGACSLLIKWWLFGVTTEITETWSRTQILRRFPSWAFRHQMQDLKHSLLLGKAQGPMTFLLIQGMTKNGRQLVAFLSEPTYGDHKSRERLLLLLSLRSVWHENSLQLLPGTIIPYPPFLVGPWKITTKLWATGSPDSDVLSNNCTY